MKNIHLERHFTVRVRRDWKKEQLAGPIELVERDPDRGVGAAHYYCSIETASDLADQLHRAIARSGEKNG